LFRWGKDWQKAAQQPLHIFLACHRSQISRLNFFRLLLMKSQNTSFAFNEMLCRKYDEKEQSKQHGPCDSRSGTIEKYPLQNVPGFDSSDIWRCTLDLASGEEQIFLFSNENLIHSVKDKAVVEYCVFRSIIYELHSCIPIFCNGVMKSISFHFGVDTGHADEYPDGRVLTFRDLLQDGACFRGMCDGIDWDSRPMQMFLSSKLAYKELDGLGLDSLDYRPSLTNHFHTKIGKNRSIGRDQLDGATQLTWKCSGCSDTNRALSRSAALLAGSAGGGGVCMREQTFHAAGNYSYYNRLRDSGKCAGPLCGLEKSAHFHCGPALLCPRFYNCCICLAQAANADREKLSFSLLHGGCMPCRRRAGLVDCTVEVEENAKHLSADAADKRRADDREVLRGLFDVADSNGDGYISAQDLRSALSLSGEGRAALAEMAQGVLLHLEQLDACSGNLADVLVAAIRTLQAGSLSSTECVDKVSFDQFAAAAGQILRVRGARLNWALSLGLDEEFSRHLAAGNMRDGLSRLRGMCESELESHLSSACSAFCASVPELVKTAVHRLRAEGTGTRNMTTAMALAGCWAVDEENATVMSLARERERREQGGLVQQSKLRLWYERAKTRAEVQRLEKDIRCVSEARSSLERERAQLAKARKNIAGMQRDVAAAERVVLLERDTLMQSTPAGQWSMGRFGAGGRGGGADGVVF
jgi:hypothetical protein